MSKPTINAVKWLVVGCVSLLAACHSPKNFYVEPPQLIGQASEEIWVDLTPYPKQPSMSASDSGTASDQWAPMGGPIGSGQGQWAVFFSDQTVRQALIRWAESSGWTFNNSLYEVDMDIPLTAEAVLLERGSFKKAVQNLVEAVSLSESPIRACFYDNNVLRIVGVNKSCDVRAQ